MGTAELRNHAITPVKLNHLSIPGYIAAWVHVAFDNHNVPVIAASSGGVRVTPQWFGLSLMWRRRFSAGCMPTVTLGETSPVNSIEASSTVSFTPDESRGSTLDITEYAPRANSELRAAMPAYVAIICP